MKILFEQYPYPASELYEALFKDESLRSLEGLKKCFDAVNTPYTVNETLRDDKQDTISFKCVGYYFCPEIGDSIYFLPRVYLKGQKVQDLRAFSTDDGGNGGKNPTEIIDTTKQALKGNTSGLSMEDYEFINDSAQWVYKSIKRYARSKGKGNIYDGNLLRIVTTPGESTETLIDTIDALEKFYREHRNLFTFIAINKRNGAKRINWRKTVATQTPFLQGNTPIYISFVSKEKTINYDEEVVVMFFSVMSYLRNRYISHGIDTNGYEILRSQEIENLIRSGRGVRMMMKMKHKYFTDSLVYLCDLLRIFFEQAYDVLGSPKKAEATIVKKYDRVFEHMLDCLIGDNLPKALKYMKDQDDDKHIDHIYNDDSLIFPGKQIYYIGDSKYYREDKTNKLGKNAVAKQYTYAKNVIQYCINIFNNKGTEDEEEIKKEEDAILKDYMYRDELTKGYNITPNFFVHGLLTSDDRKITTNFDIDKDLKLHGESGNFEKSYQFKNRLFDRDTLILQTYDINFLYLLAVYSSEREDEITKKAIRNKLRKEISKAIFEKYNIYQVCLRRGQNLAEFVKDNFYELDGRIFSFGSERILQYAEDKNERILLYAEEKNADISLVIKENGQPYLMLSHEIRNIELTKIELDKTISKEYEDPRPYENDEEQSHETDGGDEYTYIAAEDYIKIYNHDYSSLSEIDEKLFPMAIAYTKNLDWVESTGIYNFRSGENVPGSVDSYIDKIQEVRTLVLYTDKAHSQYVAFKSTYLHRANKEEMSRLNYKNPKDNYHLCLVKKIEKDIKLDFNKLKRNMSPKEAEDFWKLLLSAKLF